MRDERAVQQAVDAAVDAVFGTEPDMAVFERTIHNLQDAIEVAAERCGVPVVLAWSMLSTEYEAAMTSNGQIAPFAAEIPLPPDVPLSEILRGLTESMQKFAERLHRTGDWIMALREYAHEQRAFLPWEGRKPTEPERDAYLHRVLEYVAFYSMADGNASGTETEKEQH